MGSLCAIDQKRQEELELYNKIFDLLSFEKITFSGKTLTYCNYDGDNHVNIALMVIG